jgi:hypothetical protein
MAAHDAKILNSVVVVDSIDVIENQWHGFPHPHRLLTAYRANVLQQASFQHPLLQVVPSVRRFLD